MNFLIKLLASGFFISYIPAKITGFKKFTGSGLFGTLLAALLFLLIPEKYFLPQILAIVSIPISSWIAGKAEILFNKSDDPRIVIDEVVGYWIAVAFLTRTAENLVLAFIIFRTLDTLKPWPIKTMETKFNGGFGVVMDDVVGGIETAIIVFLLSPVITRIL